MQKADAGTVGTPKPSEEPVKQVEEKKSISENPFGFGGIIGGGMIFGGERGIGGGEGRDRRERDRDR